MRREARRRPRRAPSSRRCCPCSSMPRARRPSPSSASASSASPSLTRRPTTSVRMELSVSTRLRSPLFCLTLTHALAHAVSAIEIAAIWRRLGRWPLGRALLRGHGGRDRQRLPAHASRRQRRLLQRLRAQRERGGQRVRQHRRDGGLAVGLHGRLARAGHGIRRDGRQPAARHAGRAQRRARGGPLHEAELLLLPKRVVRQHD